MATIKQLKKLTNPDAIPSERVYEDIYPVTHERAVMDDNGNNLEQKLQNIESDVQQTIDDAESAMQDILEQSAVRTDTAQDLTDAQKATALGNLGISGVDEVPTAGSDNLVKSGGVINCISKDAVITYNIDNLPTLESGYLNNDGSVASSDTRKVTNMLSIPDNTYKINVTRSYQTVSGRCYVCFYNENNVFISALSVESSSENVSQEITNIPQGAKYVRFNYAYNASFPLLTTSIEITYKDLFDLEGIEEEVYKLQNAGYFFVGVATTSTNPNIPNENSFCIVRGVGTYTHFKNSNNQSIVIHNDGIYALTYSINNGYWEYSLIIGIDTAPSFSSNGISKSSGIYEQSATLKELGNPITKITELQQTSAGMIWNDGTIHEGTRNITGYIEISAGVEFDALIGFVSEEVLSYALYDDNHNFVEGYRESAQSVTTKKFTIRPSIRYKYVRFCSPTDDANSFKRFKSARTEIEELQNVTYVSFTQTAELEESSILDINGNVVSGSRCVTDFIEIEEEIEFSAFTGTTVGSFLAYALYDETKTFVSGYNKAMSPAQTVSYKVLKQDGIKYVRWVVGSAYEPKNYTNKIGVNKVIDDILGSGLSKRLNEKKICVLGGSVAWLLSQYHADKIIKNTTGAEIYNFAENGAGFCNHVSISNNTIVYDGASIQKEIDDLITRNIQYDIYMLWASTNDYGIIDADETKLGTFESYTYADNFNINSRLTQCGGINYCIKRLQEFSPNSRILIIGALKSFDTGGYYVENKESLNGTFKKMVNKQQECAIRFSLPFYSLWDNSGINDYNNNLYMYHDENDEVYGSPAHGNDGTHPNAEAYTMIADKISQFILCSY